jgi:hypothetical protein
MNERVWAWFDGFHPHSFPEFFLHPSEHSPRFLRVRIRVGPWWRLWALASRCMQFQLFYLVCLEPSCSIIFHGRARHRHHLVLCWVWINTEKGQIHIQWWDCVPWEDLLNVRVKIEPWNGSSNRYQKECKDGNWLWRPSHRRQCGFY